MIAAIKRKVRQHHRVIRYLFSGGSAFLTEYVIFLLLFYALFEGSIVLANIVSYCSGFLVSFLLNRAWVFKSDNHHYGLRRQITLYVLLGLVNLVISTIAINVLHHYLPGYIAKIITVVAIAAWNFVVYQKILFRERSHDALSV